jgi:hypothetical protein
MVKKESKKINKKPGLDRSRKGYHSPKTRQMDTLTKFWNQWKNAKNVKKIFTKSLNVYNPKKAKASIDRVFTKLKDPNSHFNEMVVRYFQKNVGNAPLIAREISIIYTSPTDIQYIGNALTIHLNDDSVIHYLNEIKKGEIVDIFMQGFTIEPYGYGYPELHSIKAFP